MKKIKEQIIINVAKSGEGHIPSALSVLDILWVLYHKILKIDPKNPKDENRDRFVLSKGHASIGLYAILADIGFFSVEALETFSAYDSFLGGHPDCNKVPGIEASTGSLGHGMPVAIGMALGLKIKSAQSRVFCLIGDGEANEGTIWESALLAGHHKLNNFYCIIDHNRSTERALSVDDLLKKFEAFNWETRVVNGHNHSELEKVFTVSSTDKPVAIIANTVKGCGVKLMENNQAWHHRTPNKEELDQIIKDLV